MSEVINENFDMQDVLDARYFAEHTLSEIDSTRTIKQTVLEFAKLAMAAVAVDGMHVYTMTTNLLAGYIQTLPRGKEEQFDALLIFWAELFAKFGLPSGYSDEEGD